MTSAIEELKPALAQLSEQDRAELACFLLRSLDNAEEEPGAEEAWEEELAQREQEIVSGQTMGESAENVFARLRQKYP